MTKREQRILAEVAEIFRDVSAAQIGDVSHARNGPWDAARKRGQGKWRAIVNCYKKSLEISDALMKFLHGT